MTIASMTGFACTEGQAGDTAWCWEIKSVNGRGLDLRFRLPAGFESLEMAAREAVQRHVKRGSLSINLSLTRTQKEGGVRVNAVALEAMLRLVGEVAARLPQTAPPSAEGILGLRGVLEPAVGEEDTDARAALDPALRAGLAAALEGLEAVRRQEGVALAAALAAILDEIARHAADAARAAAEQPAAVRDRLRAQLAQIVESGAPVPEDRIAQEIAMLATRADVREELDRLAAHVTAVRALLAEAGPIGRKLDFLCQELNRETNTVCSKSLTLALTRSGLALKAAIDQLREQAQNVE